MTTVPLEMWLQGFKQSFGCRHILVSVRWKRARCRQAALVVLDHPFGAGGPGRADMGGVCSWSSLHPLIMPAVNKVQCENRSRRNMAPFWKALGLCPVYVDPGADWSRRGLFTCGDNPSPSAALGGLCT